jgi:hypothetical protein
MFENKVLLSAALAKIHFWSGLHKRRNKIARVHLDIRCVQRQLSWKPNILVSYVKKINVKRFSYTEFYLFLHTTQKISFFVKQLHEHTEHQNVCAIFFVQCFDILKYVDTLFQ